MRRKSERAVKKTKSTPDVEKPKRTRTRRSKKNSSSSENEPADDESPVTKITPSEPVEKKSPVKQGPKEENAEEKADQVWQVKTSESSGDSGEIKKLKICLARPPSTPERADKSPRSRRKHTRTTSSSDTPSENTEEKKKVRRSKRSKDSDGDKSQDSQGDEADSEPADADFKNDEQQPVHTSTCDDEVPMSTTDETKIEEKESRKPDETPTSDKMDIADTTVDSSVADSQVSQPETQDSTEHERSHTPEPSKQTDSPENKQSHTPRKSDSQKQLVSSNTPEPTQLSEEVEPAKNEESPNKSQSSEQPQSPKQPRSPSPKQPQSPKQPHSPKQLEPSKQELPKKLESSMELESPKQAEVPISKQSESHEQSRSPKGSETPEQQAAIQSRSSKKSESGKRSVSPKSSQSSSRRWSKRSDLPKESEPTKPEEESENELEVELQISHREEAKINEGNCSPMKTDEEKTGHTKETKKSEAFKKVSPKKVDRKISMSSDAEKNEEHDSSNHVTSKEEDNETIPSVPFVINRKRKWGSRPHKLTTQKSMTISTDILKDIIPDVKPVEFEEVLEKKKHTKSSEKVTRPILPKIVIDNTTHDEDLIIEELPKNEHLPDRNRRVSIVNDNDIIMKPLSPPRNKSSSVLYISNLVRPFTLLQLKNLLQRTGRIVEDGFWIDKIKSKCYVKYETEDQAVETRHALHGVTWPISNPKTLQVDFSSQEAFDEAKNSGKDTEAAPSAIPGTVEDWLMEQDMKRKNVELEKPWQRKMAVREWDVGKGEDKEPRRIEEKPERRRHRTPELSPEPAKKFKKKEEEAPAKLLDDLFKKTKTTPCIYWLPLSAETIAIKEEQRRKQLAEHERRMQEIRRQRRH